MSSTLTVVSLLLLLFAGLVFLVCRHRDAISHALAVAAQIMHEYNDQYNHHDDDDDNDTDNGDDNSNVNKTD